MESSQTSSLICLVIGQWALLSKQLHMASLCDLAFMAQGIGSKDKSFKREPEGNLRNQAVSVPSHSTLLWKKVSKATHVPGEKSDALRLDRRNVNEFEDTFKNHHPAA